MHACLPACIYARAHTHTGPDRDADERLLEKARAVRWLHDRPFIQKRIEQEEAAVARSHARDPRCISAVEAYNVRGRELRVAARCGQLDRVRALVEEGVPVNFRDIVRDTALHWASYTGEIKAVRLLIDLGADVNLQTEMGRTPLHIAAAATHPRVVFELLKRGADVHVRDYSNFTAMDLALHVQEHDDLSFVEPHAVIELLREAGGMRCRPPSPECRFAARVWAVCVCVCVCVCVTLETCVTVQLSRARAMPGPPMPARLLTTTPSSRCPRGSGSSTCTTRRELPRERTRSMTL